MRGSSPLRKMRIPAFQIERDRLESHARLDELRRLPQAEREIVRAILRLMFWTISRRAHSLDLRQRIERIPARGGQPIALLGVESRQLARQGRGVYAEREIVHSLHHGNRRRAARAFG